MGVVGLPVLAHVPTPQRTLHLHVTWGRTKILSTLPRGSSSIWSCSLSRRAVLVITPIERVILFTLPMNQWEKGQCPPHAQGSLLFWTHVVNWEACSTTHDFSVNEPSHSGCVYLCLHTNMGFCVCVSPI